MKKTIALTLTGLAIMFAGCGPAPSTDPKDVQPTQPNVSEWQYANGDHFSSKNSTVTGTQMESDCDNNNKMWIVLGSVPTASTTMKIVSYSKDSLAGDELKIDIAHSNDDYLSTGNDNKMATITVDNGKLKVAFDTVSFARYGTSGPQGDSTHISGYLNQQ